jgi:hypothetical protein
MITTEGLTTTVKFGSKQKASISVNMKKGTLTLQELAKDKKIGDPLVAGDFHELPKVEMEFFTLESVNVVIKALEMMKKNFVKPSPTQMYTTEWITFEYGDQLAQAC